jgi:hypothetical protein
MASVEEALKTQIRNIEARSGKSMKEWKGVIAASGLTKHSEGDANRTALVTKGDAKPAPAKPVKGEVSAVHDALLAEVRRLGTDIEVAPKKGYVSLRRAKQFAMLRPAANHVDVGLILPEAKVTKRLESAATFNAMFSHRVRVSTAEEIDAQLKGWLKAAYVRAG